MTDMPMTPVPSTGPGYSPFATPLQRTQPWVRFLAIMGFVSAGFMVVLGLAGGALGAMTGSFQTVAMMVLYPILGVVYVFPSMFLLRYADRIKSFLASGLDQDLAGALDAQRSFWKFAGILTIVSLIGSIVFMVVVVFVAIAFGSGGFGIAS